MITSNTFEKLREYFGSHSEAARFLGVSPRRYREWREACNLPKAREEQIGRVLGMIQNKKAV